MTKPNDNSRDRQRALDIEVRIPASGQQPPVWASRPDEAGRWIVELAEYAFREAFDGTVTPGHAYAEADAFVQYLTAMAHPTAANREVIRGDLRGLVSRLEHDLSIKFDCGQQRPSVSLDPDRTFLGHDTQLPTRHSGESPSNGGQTTLHMLEGHQNGSSDSLSQRTIQGRQTGSALMWTGACLGGALIAAAFLGWNVIELREEVRQTRDLQATVSRLTTDLRLLSSARSFETMECQRSIREHRTMITNLAKQCTPKQPAPTPPAPPAPYPNSPDPFATR